MKKSSMTRVLIVAFILIFGTAALGYAAATVTAHPNGTGQIIVQGDGFVGVEGIQIVIQYDHTALTNLRAEQGGLIQGMTMVPPSIDVSGCSGLCYSGTYKYPYVTPTTAGSIATISFDKLGDAATNVTGTATLKDINGNPQVKSFTVTVTGSASINTTDGANNGTNTGANNGTNNGANTGANNGASTTTDTTTGSGSGTTVTTTGTAPQPATGGSVPIVLGSISMSDSGTPVTAKTESDASPSVAKVMAPPTGETALQSAIQEKSALLTKSALEQFRDYQGERSPQNLIALFKSAITGRGQEPPLALSDGKTAVRMVVDLSATGKAAPNFALKGAKLVSLKISSDSAWVVEVLPDKGVLDAAVVVLADDKAVELPLTVAPPLSADVKLGKGGVLSEADFISYLQDRGTEKAPRFDLNGDGKRDYIDDYIFTANFLARADAAEAAAEKNSQGAE